MLTRLRRNFALKVFSFVLAVAAWAYFRFANPALAVRFDQQLSVPITTTGLRAGTVARYTEKQAVVTIVAPRNGPVRPDEVKAVLNLHHRAPGVYAVPLTIVAPNLEIKQLSPASVSLVIDPIEDRTVPVAVRYAGDRRSDIVVTGLRVEPGTVLLRGVSVDLDKVESVRIDVPLQTAPATLDAMVKPRLVDLRGDDVSNVVVSPDLVRVRARFEKGKG